MPEVGAVILDVGGVLLLPEPRIVSRALREGDLVHDPDALHLAHYGGVAAVDADPSAWPVGGAPRAYLTGFARAAGVPEDRLDAATRLLHQRVFTRPSIEVWRRTTPWAAEGLRLLRRGGLPVAVVSNSDGTAEAQLREHGLAQCGPGPGLDVTVIVDSAVVGAAKPDPAAFAPALKALAVEPDRGLYVGDTVAYDVKGARAAGLRAVHLDPIGYCTAGDHAHAPDLPTALERLSGPSRPA